MKKLNWGWRIVLLYSAFVIMILYLVYRSVNMKTELVTKDYYAQELKYQEQLDKMRRTNSLKEKLVWTVAEKKVELKFPVSEVGKNIHAEIIFYRASDSSKDFATSCSPDSTGYCQVVSNKFVHGVYKMEINWTAGADTYYSEGVINVN